MVNLVRNALSICALLAFATVAFAIAYCPKPNGIATRDYAFNKLQELRGDLAARFGSSKRYLIVASIPDSVQKTTEFKSIEERESVLQLSELPAFRAAAVEWAKENGLQVSPADAVREFATTVYQQKSTKPDESIGLIYLFSNHLELLRRMSPTIAHSKGLVVEGEPVDITTLLTAGKGNTKMHGWWSNILSKDVDLVVFAGFSPSADVRELVRREAQVLRVSTWETATETGLRQYRALMDVSPRDASVLNLLPLSMGETNGWGMTDTVAAAYVANGRKLQAEIQKLGYVAQRPADLSSAEAVVKHLQEASKAGKKVLVYAETTHSADSQQIVRLPGQAVGLTAKDLLSLDDSVLANIMFVSCNSQALSPKLPLSVVGTIYTDAANNLVRQTFAAPQADSMGDYLQASTVRTTSWLEPIARVAASLDRTGSVAERAKAVQDGSLTFRPVAFVTQVVRPPAPVVAGTPSGSGPAQSPATSSPSPITPLNLTLFLTGVFGALCREGIRWKRLVEQKRARAFVRAPYLLLSAALMIAAGGVGYLFAQQFSSVPFSLIVAFVAGVGFEKIVKMAAELKIWTPTKAVPMGTTSTSDLERELNTSELLSFLRHGD